MYLVYWVIVHKQVSMVLAFATVISTLSTLEITIKLFFLWGK